MTRHPDTVKIDNPDGAGRDKGGPYHHGALREALIDAAVSIIAERGVDGFSLREAARRAGVSPAAPQHHFGDVRGLLTAIATAGFAELGDALAAADAQGPQDLPARLRRQGEAYVRFALRQPARFDVMWRKTRIDPDDAALRQAATRAYGFLKAAAGGDAQDNEVRAVAAWSLVHGFARLALDGALGSEPGAAARAADALLAGVMERLKD
ncbi:TetR/AcrR family transcriptional regulator [Methylopila turkensis]|uniref:TetR family transcriptional regulator n=1 Tax=Methylopila turkensis TaxID=1437816 RepID=A0A9W6N7D7_9HYPH|nr:TetR/AcrR family transcriptional regulator [Methylopila turkensis]GLK80428.1 TetR family transcriptional regulator [Methylopila turkensis]